MTEILQLKHTIHNIVSTKLINVFLSLIKLLSVETMNENNEDLKVSKKVKTSPKKSHNSSEISSVCNKKANIGSERSNVLPRTYAACVSGSSRTDADAQQTTNNNQAVDERRSPNSKELKTENDSKVGQFLIRYLNVASF